MLHLSDNSLPWPRWEGLKHAKEVVLQDDLHVELWTIKRGTKVKLFIGRNFGYCIVPKDAVPFGIKRIFKY